MDETKDTEFTINAGLWYELPVDSSLNQLEKELKAELTPGKKAPSRKLIRQSLLYLAECDEKYSRGLDAVNDDEALYLFDRVWGNRYRTDDEKDLAGTTHPATIHWETVPLLKALALTRANVRSAKGEQLAQLTLESLYDQYLNLPVAEMKENYFSLQILRDECAQKYLIQKHQDQVIQRLDLIYYLTLVQQSEAAAQNMREAIPGLDALLVNLLQNVSQEPNGSQESHTERLNHLYDNLRSVRDSSVFSDADKSVYGIEDTKIKFSLPENSEFLKQIREDLSTPWRKMPSAKKAEIRKNYEKYLVYCFRRTEEADGIRSLLEKHDTLTTYIRTVETWNDIQTAVREELCEYVKGIFADIKRGDVDFPYVYSGYKGKTASSAFISELTKSVHDQIRKDVHQPLRLLLTVRYAEIFELKTAVMESMERDAQLQALFALVTGKILIPHGQTEMFSPVFSKTLFPKLNKWLDNADNEILSLKNKFPHLPILTREDNLDLAAFMDTYEKTVLVMFPEQSPSKEKLRSSAEKTRNKATPLITKVLAVGDLLEADAWLVAADIIARALEEIGQRYRYLRDSYDRFEKAQQSFQQANQE